MAVHVQTIIEEHLKDEAKDRIQETLSLAERLTPYFRSIAITY